MYLSSYLLIHRFIHFFYVLYVQNGLSKIICSTPLMSPAPRPGATAGRILGCQGPTKTGGFLLSKVVVYRGKMTKSTLIWIEIIIDIDLYIYIYVKKKRWENMSKQKLMQMDDIMICSYRLEVSRDSPLKLFPTGRLGTRMIGLKGFCIDGC